MANFNINKVILGGRLTADPELKATQSGASVCSFGLAVSRKYSKEGEQNTDFINCVPHGDRPQSLSADTSRKVLPFVSLEAFKREAGKTTTEASGMQRK